MEKICQFFVSYKNHVDEMSALDFKLSKLKGHVKNFEDNMSVLLEGKHKKILEGYYKISSKTKCVIKKILTLNLSCKNVIKTYFHYNELSEKFVCIAHTI